MSTTPTLMTAPTKMTCSSRIPYIDISYLGLHILFTRHFS
jgi:hypothetical protein